MSTRDLRWCHRVPLTLLLMSPFDVIASLGMDFYLPVVPKMPGILDTSEGVIQFTLTVYLVILGVGQLLCGPLSDRISRRPVLLGGAALFVLASLVLAETATASVFVGARIVQAIGASAMLVATFATVRDAFGKDPKSSTTIYSLLGAILSFVPAIGPFLGAMVSNAFGWRAIFLVLAGGALVAGTHATMRWPETRPIGAVRRTTYLPMLRNLRFWTFTLGYSAAMGSFFVYFSTSSHVLIDQAGLSEITFSLAFGSAAAVMIATTRAVGWMVPRWGISGCLLRGMGCLYIGGILLAFGQVSLGPSFLGFVIPMWLISVGIVVTCAVTANGALGAFDDMAGAAVALYSSLQSVIAGLVGTTVITLLGSDSGWPLAVYAIGMATSCAIAHAILQHRSGSQQDTVATPAI